MMQPSLAPTALFSRFLAAAVCTWTLAGCAPDALNDSASVEGFYNQIEQACRYDRIGEYEVWWLVENSAFFLDTTSRLYYGEVSKSEYANNLNNLYPGTANQRAYDCIFANLPKTPPHRPPPLVPGLGKSGL